MIDEKKLIKEFRKKNKSDHNNFLFTFEEIKNTIKAQPKADWIPYTTNGELPCNGQKVWISFTNEVCSYVKQAWWIYDHFEWDNAKRVKDCPTAWMPYIVPQPYKKEGAEDESN